MVSLVFCVAVTPDLQQQILSVLQFKAGNLPIIFLKCTRKLSSKHCNPLTEKITARLNSWIAILFLRQSLNSLDAA